MRVRKEFNELATMMRTTPCMIADYCGANPIRIERLLRVRGQMRDGESINDAIIRNYGERVYAKCETLAGVCPLESEKEDEQ